MFKRIDLDTILRSHTEIRLKYILTMAQTLGEHTRRHLQRGFLNRLSMMEDSVLFLDDELNKIKGPISAYACIRLMLFLNGYYLNLTGSLDNLAWALTYQHELLKNIDESRRKHRSFVQLVGKDFFSALDKRQLTPLREKLEVLSEWYWQVREFRDAAAHPYTALGASRRLFRRRR